MGSSHAVSEIRPCSLCNKSCKVLCANIKYYVYSTCEYINYSADKARGCGTYPLSLISQTSRPGQQACNVVITHTHTMSLCRYSNTMLLHAEVIRYVVSYRDTLFSSTAGSYKSMSQNKEHKVPGREEEPAVSMT